MLINTYLSIVVIGLSCRGWNTKLYSIVLCVLDMVIVHLIAAHPSARSPSSVQRFKGLAMASSAQLQKHYSGLFWPCKSRPAHALGSAQWAADWTKGPWSVVMSRLRYMLLNLDCSWTQKISWEQKAKSWLSMRWCLGYQMRKGITVDGCASRLPVR